MALGKPWMVCIFVPVKKKRKERNPENNRESKRKLIEWNDKLVCHICGWRVKSKGGMRGRGQRIKI